MPSLTPDQWQEVSPYLDEVLEIDPDNRAAWLLFASREEMPSWLPWCRRFWTISSNWSKKGFLSDPF